MADGGDCSDADTADMAHSAQDRQRGPRYWGVRLARVIIDDA